MGEQYQRNRAIVLSRPWHCSWCNALCNDREPGPDNPRGVTTDHIIPKAQGGTDRLSNLQIMCWLCNQIKADGEGNGRRPLGALLPEKVRRALFELVDHPKSERWRNQ